MRIQRLTASAVSWFPLTFCIALSVGASLGMATILDKAPAFQLTNKLADDLLNRAVLVSLVCTGVVLILYGLAAAALRLLKKKPLEESVRLINRHAFILLALPVFISFQTKDLARDHPFATLFGCLAVAVVAGIYFYRLPRVAWNRLPLKENLYKWASIVVVAAAATGFAVLITRFSIQHMQNLRAGNYDLGVYVNTLWNTARGDLLRCTLVRGGYHIYAHFDPILILFSPVMWFDPKPENIIATQSIWLALGVVPLYLITLHHLKRHWLALILCLAYLLYPGVHGPAMYDFHSVTLAGPVIMWSLFFAETRRTVLYFVSIVFLLLTREDLGLAMFFVGFYLFYSNHAARTGLATMALCLAYYFAITRTVMAAEKTFSYDYYFEALQVGDRSLAGSLLTTLFGNPMFIVRQALTEDKLKYFIQLALPLAGLPLFAGKRWFVFFYGILVTALVSKPAVYNINFQYTTFIYPFFFALTPHVLKNIAGSDLLGRIGFDPNRLMGAFTAVIMAASVAVSYNYGVFRESSAFKQGQSHFDRNPTEFQVARYGTVRKIQALIPADASVTASKMIGAHFSTRRYIYQFKDRIDTDYYILLDKDVVRREYRKRYERFLEKDKYDLILQENEIKVFIRKDLNKGRYPVLRVKNVRRPIT